MKSRLFLSRSEKRGLLLLLLLLLCVGGGLMYVRTNQAERKAVTLSKEDEEALEAFAETTKARQAQRETGEVEPTAPFPFNPNTADSVTLRRLGLSARQTKNLMAYRRAGGRWKNADDFRRLYGLSEEEFKRLRPYIQIPEATKNTYYTATDRGRQDSISRQYPEKFNKLTVLNLNTVDTLTLSKIPGIGPSYSRSIVRYRERLGGFVNTAQLNEIEGLPERIEEWFVVETGVSVQQIPVNTSDFRTLVHHPYLNYEQVKVIVTHIRKYGPLRSWNDLRLYDVFTQADFDRLQPYFSFE